MLVFQHFHPFRQKSTDARKPEQKRSLSPPPLSALLQPAAGGYGVVVEVRAEQPHDGREQPLGAPS